MKHFLLGRGPVAAVLLAVLGTAGTAGAQTDPNAFEPFVNAYDMREVAADASGGLWLATNGGAVRFDTATESWAAYPRRRTGGPVSNDLTTITVDAAGLVWCGSEAEGVSTYDPSRDRWERFEEIPDPRARVIRTSGGQVGIGTQSGLSFRARSGRVEVCNEIDRGCIVPSFVISDFAWLGDTLWVGTQGGLGRFNGSTWDPASNLPEDSVGPQCRSLAVFEGKLWEVAGTAVRRLDPAGWTTIQGETADRLVVSGGRLFAIDGAVLKVRAVGEGHFASVNLGTSVPIRDLEVAAGNYYLATSSGLVVVPVGGGASRTLYPPGPQIPDFHRSLAVDRDGIVWVGNQNGLLRYDGTTWSATYRGAGGLGSGWTFALAVAGNELAVANCCCDSPPACPFNIRSDAGIQTLDVYDVWSLDIDAKGRLWAATDDDGALVLERGNDGVWDVVLEITNATTSLALKSNALRSIAVTPQGTYFGHESGPGVDFWPHGDDIGSGFNPGAWQHISVSTDLLDGSVGAMRASGNDVWVGTATGLHRINSGVVIERFSTSFNQEIPGDLPRAVRAIVVDRRGNVWCGTGGGVLLLERGSDELRRFDTEVSNLTSNDVLSGALNPTDGSVWFGTALGITRVDPDRVIGASPAAASFVVYPNPVSPGQNLYVYLGIAQPGGPASASGASLEEALVYDMTGRRVGAFELSGDEWRWRVVDAKTKIAPAPGLYLVRGRSVSGEAIELKLGIVR